MAALAAGELDLVIGRPAHAAAKAEAEGAPALWRGAGRGAAPGRPHGPRGERLALTALAGSRLLLLKGNPISDACCSTSPPAGPCRWSPHQRPEKHGLSVLRIFARRRRAAYYLPSKFRLPYGQQDIELPTFPESWIASALADEFSVMIRTARPLHSETCRRGTKTVNVS